MIKNEKILVFLLIFIFNLTNSYRIQKNYPTSEFNEKNWIYISKTLVHKDTPSKLHIDFLVLHPFVNNDKPLNIFKFFITHDKKNHEYYTEKFIKDYFCKL